MATLTLLSIGLIGAVILSPGSLILAGLWAFSLSWLAVEFG